MRVTRELLALGEPERWPHVGPAPKRGAGRAERTGDDEFVTRTGAGSAGHTLGPANGCDAQRELPRVGRVAADHGHAGFRNALVERDDVVDARRARRRQRDDQPLRLRARRREVTEIHRRGTETEIAPRDPVEPEVDALDERVLRDHEAAVELCRVVLDPACKTAAFELGEKPELAELRELHRSPAGALPRRAPRG